MNESLLVAIISTAGGIVIAYITSVLSKRKKAGSHPSQRIDVIYQGYENLIKSQQRDIDRKSTLIDSLENLVNKQQEEIAELKSIIQTLKDQIKDTEKQTTTLKAELKELKAKFGTDPVIEGAI